MLAQTKFYTQEVCEILLIGNGLQNIFLKKDSFCCLFLFSVRVHRMEIILFKEIREGKSWWFQWTEIELSENTDKLEETLT